MPAAVYRGPGQVVIETLPVPDLRPGEVLVEVAACGVCGTDLKKIRHGLQAPPRVYGHETVGRIAAVGDGVGEWSVGDRVAVYHHIPCGQCHYCRHGVAAQCAVYKRTGVTAGFEPAGGGYAGYVKAMDWIVAGGGLVRVPEGVSDEAATFVEPVNTCLKGLQRAGVEAGDLVQVIGAGPIGLLLMQLCRAAGASVVITDPLPGRRQVAARLGGVAVTPDEVREAVLERTDGRGADAVILAVPRADLIAGALALTRPGGRVLLFAQTRRDDPFTADAGEVCTLDKTVLGSYSSDVRLNQAAAEAVFSGRIDVTALITHRFPLDKIAEAIRTAETPADDVLKVIVTR